MGNKGQAVGGSIGGGLLGGIIGLVLGGLLGPMLAGVGRHDNTSLLAAFDSCFGFIFGLVGAAIGGVVCAIGGAALGAGLATRSPDPLETQDSNAIAGEWSAPEVHTSPPTESPTEEMARLKKRLAELEGRTDQPENT